VSNIQKIFYWSPYLSQVATVKNVLNSAKYLKYYSKNKLIVGLIDVIGEWSQYRKKIIEDDLEIIKVSSLNLSKFFPISGFFKSRLIYLLIGIVSFFSLKRVIKKKKPSYLIIHLVTFLPLILLLLFKFETKFILRISGLPKFNFIRTLLWKLVSKRIFAITCPSSQTKDDLVKLNIFPREKIKILYDPIIEVNKIKKKMNKKKNFYLKNEKFFLNIGRLTRQKNQILLLKMFLEITKKNHDLKLLIIGDGEEKLVLRNFIEKNSLNEKVYLMGYVENVYPYIVNSIAVITCSLWEDPGAVMIETSFCNKPVISSNCRNGPKEFLNNSKGGYLFENDNLNSLIEQTNIFLKEDNSKKLAKILMSKKNSRNYTVFNHTLSLKKILKIT
jgi:glycosyltransferase involved in cell wall biosynthesis